MSAFQSLNDEDSEPIFQHEQDDDLGTVISADDDIVAGLEPIPLPAVEVAAKPVTQPATLDTSTPKAMIRNHSRRMSDSSLIKPAAPIPQSESTPLSNWQTFESVPAIPTPSRSRSSSTQQPPTVSINPVEVPMSTAPVLTPQQTMLLQQQQQQQFMLQQQLMMQQQIQSQLANQAYLEQQHQQHVLYQQMLFQQQQQQQQGQLTPQPQPQQRNSFTQSQLPATVLAAPPVLQRSHTVPTQSPFSVADDNPFLSIEKDLASPHTPAAASSAVNPFLAPTVLPSPTVANPTPVTRSVRERLEALQKRHTDMFGPDAMIAHEVLLKDMATAERKCHEFEQSQAIFTDEYHRIIADLKQQQLEMSQRVKSAEALAEQVTVERRQEIATLRESLAQMHRQFGLTSEHRRVTLLPETEAERNACVQAVYAFLRGLDAKTYQQLVSKVIS